MRRLLIVYHNKNLSSYLKGIAPLWGSGGCKLPLCDKIASLKFQVGLGSLLYYREAETGRVAGKMWLLIPYSVTIERATFVTRSMSFEAPVVTSPKMICSAT